MFDARVFWTRVAGKRGEVDQFELMVGSACLCFLQDGTQEHSSVASERDGVLDD